MPTSFEHKKKAEHNETFAQSIDGKLYSDWTVIALFYSALHYVDAFLAFNGIHPAHHTGAGGRDNEVKNSLPVIWDEYRYLKDESEAARYYTRSFDYKDVSTNIQPEYEVIKRYVLPLLP